MDMKDAAETLDANADFRVLRRLRISDAHVFAENVNGESCGRLAVVDTETTGLKVELGDRIIDLAIATCEYLMGRATLTARLSRIRAANQAEVCFRQHSTGWFFRSLAE